jgi:hypothetical protein
MPRAPFTPIADGFAFANTFINHVVRIPFLGIDITTRGRCGGMAYAAMDMWIHGLAVSRNAALPADGTLLADYVYARLLDSMAANGAKFFDVMQSLDHPTAIRGKGVARATREDEYPRIKARIDQGFPCVVGLSQARDLAGMGHDHQVVAYGYEDGNPRSKVFIWDNDEPGVELALDFTTAYDPGDRAVMLGAQAWRGFFLESYAPVVPPFLQAGRLLSDRSDPAVHVVQGGGRFWIPSPAEFSAGGYHWTEVLEAQDGSMAHIATAPGDETLVKERSHAEVYVVQGGRAFHIPDPKAFTDMGFLPTSIRQVPDGSTAPLVGAAPADGTLLKEFGDAAVHLVVGGSLRHIANPATFDQIGLSWGKVRTVPAGGLAALPHGAQLPTLP